MYGYCSKCGHFANMINSTLAGSHVCSVCAELERVKHGPIPVPVRIPVIIPGVFVEVHKILLEKPDTFPTCTRCGEVANASGSMIFDKPYCEGCSEKAKTIVEIFAESYGGKK